MGNNQSLFGTLVPPDLDHHRYLANFSHLFPPFGPSPATAAEVRARTSRDLTPAPALFMTFVGTDDVGSGR